MSRFKQITDIFPIFTSLGDLSVFTRPVVSHDRHGGPLSCAIHPTTLVRYSPDDTEPDDIESAAWLPRRRHMIPVIFRLASDEGRSLKAPAAGKSHEHATRTRGVAGEA